MTSKQLRKITQEEFDKALQDHFLYQKGDESKQMIFKNCDFSGIKLFNSNLSGAIFDGSDFRNAVSVSEYGRVGDHNYQNQFKGCILDNVSFKNCNLEYIKFSSIKNLKGAILIGAKFDSRLLSESQKEEIFVTEKELELAKQTKNQESIIEKKDEVIEKTSQKQSKDMLDIFQELQKDFAFEERLWIVFGYMVFSILLIITSSIVSNISPVLSAFINFIFLTAIALILDLTKNKEKNKVIYTLDEQITIIFISIVALGPLIYFGHESWIIISKSGESLFKIMDVQNMKWEFIAPISILFFSIFWFSIHQYGRAKKLRIEQQNKQAMIHFMQAVIANDGKGSPADRSFPQLAPFFANAIIHRPFSQENYDPQLPIDEVKKVIDMAKLFQK